MTYTEVLNEIYGEYMNRVFRCSDNYLMTHPKRGMEGEFFHCKEIADRVHEILMDYTGDNK